MSKERDISFPPGEIGKLHTEHGRTWKYVEPGMWKSVNTSGGGGGGSGPEGETTWDDVIEKPTEFPPESHTHDQYALSDDVDTDVQRIETEQLNLSGEISAEAATRKSNDDALGLRIDAVEGSIGDGGGFVDAPDDGKLYGRQSEAWAEVVIPDAGASSWNDLTDKPTEFPPESHNHVVADITDFDPLDYQPVGDYATTTYVDDSIAAIDIPEVDLTGYATETYVDDSIAAIDIPDEYDDSGIKSDIDAETQARIDGDAVLQSNIDAIPEQLIKPNNDGGNNNAEFKGDQFWVTNLSEPVFVGAKIASDSEFTGTVTAFKFSGDGSLLTNLPSPGAPAWGDITGKPADYPPSSHGHAWGEISGKPAFYDGADAVKLTGNQTIGGAKTFSSNVTAPDFVATSDIAMKMNVQTAPVGLIDQIRGVEFDWRNSGSAASGVIANEIEKVLPHLVQEHQGVKHVSYMGLIAYLIEEIKALKNAN